MRNGKITVGLGAVRGLDLVSVTVKINGAKAAGPHHPHGGQSFTLASLPEGQFVVEIIVAGQGGRRLNLARHYKACASGLGTNHPVPPVPPVAPPSSGSSSTPSGPSTPAPEVSTPPPPAPSAPQAGHFTGNNPQNLLNGRIEFFVSPAGNLQDVQVWETKLACAPTNTVRSRFEMPEVTVAADGSFSGTSHQNGVIEGVPATFTYTLSGNLQEKSASGSFREDVTFDNGTSYNCSTNSQTWTATRDSTQDPLLLPAQPGRYEGNNPQNLLNGRVEFFVSPAGNLQDVQVWETKLACTPSKTIENRFEMAEVPVAADGSFSGTTHQDAVIEGTDATITYTFSGHIHGAGSDGRPRVAGVFREDIAFDNGTSFSCTTNNQSWDATRDQTQNPLLLPAQPGRYEGNNPQNLLNGRVEFFVSPAGNLQDVQVWETKLACAPTNTVRSRFEMSEITVAADGSFSKTTQQTGIVEGSAATFTYTFSGHVHGAGSSGNPRVAGVFREDVTFNNGTSFSCSTNNQPWTASRDATQSPLVLPAQAGHYKGNNPQNLLNGRPEFVVSAAGNLQNVQIAETRLACTPSKTVNSHFEMAEVPVDANGSFSSIGHSTAVVEGVTANITYTFSGHVHGAGSDGKPRVAGVFREDMSFNNGTSFSCTTNNQSWNAGREGS